VLDCLTDYHVIEDDKLCTEATIRKSNGHKDWECIILLSWEQT